MIHYMEETKSTKVVNIPLPVVSVLLPVVIITEHSSHASFSHLA